MSHRYGSLPNQRRIQRQGTLHLGSATSFSTTVDMAGLEVFSGGHNTSIKPAAACIHTVQHGVHGCPGVTKTTCQSPHKRIRQEENPRRRILRYLDSLNSSRSSVELRVESDGVW